MDFKSHSTVLWRIIDNTGFVLSIIQLKDHPKAKIYCFANAVHQSFFLCKAVLKSKFNTFSRTPLYQLIQ